MRGTESSFALINLVQKTTWQWLRAQPLVPREVTLNTKKNDERQSFLSRVMTKENDRTMTGEFGKSVTYETLNIL